MGKAYSDERIRSSVFAMATEPIAYSMLALDKLKGRSSDDLEKHKSLFTRRYINPARELVAQLYDGSLYITDEVICSTAGITQEELNMAREVERSLSAPQDMMSRMRAMQSSKGEMNKRQYIK